MQFEGFNKFLQDYLASTEKYFRNIADSCSATNIVQEIIEYGSQVKKDVAERYYRLNSELQYQGIAAFDDFMNRCNALIDDTMEILNKNEIIIALSNDIFYNDESLGVSK